MGIGNVSERRLAQPSIGISVVISRSARMATARPTEAAVYGCRWSAASDNPSWVPGRYRAVTCV